MTQLLLDASQSAGIKVTKADATDGQIFAQYGVYETQFWAVIYAAAKRPEKVAEVLESMVELENEPCSERESVWGAIKNARRVAEATLRSREIA